MIRVSIFKATVMLAFVPMILFASLRSPLADSTRFSTVRYGPFALLNSSGDTVQVFVEVGHVHLDVEEYGNWSDTDYSYTFLDSRGKIYLRSVGRCDHADGSTSMRAMQLSVPRVGPLIILMSQTDPSAPPVETEGTLYGFDQFDHLVPLSRSMIGCGDMETTTFRPVLIKASQYGDTDSQYASDDHADPAIETERCKPNYSIFNLYPVWWTHRSPGILHQSKYRIQVETLDAAKSRRRYREAKQDSILNVYTNPGDDNQSTRAIGLRENSSFRFIDAVEHDGWWLHVVIDGIEGYVKQSDFVKLGLSDNY